MRFCFRSDDVLAGRRQISATTTTTTRQYCVYLWFSYISIHIYNTFIVVVFILNFLFVFKWCRFSTPPPPPSPNLFACLSVCRSAPLVVLQPIASAFALVFYIIYFIFLNSKRLAGLLACLFVFLIQSQFVLRPISSEGWAIHASMRRIFDLMTYSILLSE